jgi:hypothetical protein
VPKLNAFPDIGKIDDLKGFIRFASQLIENITDVVNGELEFDSNIKTQTIQVTFSTANADVMVAHKLNKKPVNFEIISKSVACDVYRSSTSADTNSVTYLRCNAATVLTLRLS